MQLTTLDWTLIAAYFALALGVGLWASKKAKTDAAGYFLARPKHALVASRGQHGGHHLQHRHPQPCH